VAVGGAALVGCGSVALRGARGRGAARALLVLLVVGLGWALRGEGPDRPAPLSAADLERARGGLLITVDGAPGHGRDVRTESMWIAPASHRPGILAGLLTGRHPLAMGWPIGEGRDAPRPAGGPLTLMERVHALGLEVAAFGEGRLAGWASAGAELRAGDLVGALRWVHAGEGRPRFAHVHLPALAAADVSRARRRCEELGLAAVAVWLGGTDPVEEPPGRFLGGAAAERRVAFWGATAAGCVPGVEYGVERPALSLCNAGDALLREMHLTGPLASLVPAVLFEAGPRDRPHRLFGRLPAEGGAHLDLSVELTPLGSDPVRDWRLGGAPQGSLAFRNVVRASWGSRGEEGAGPGGDGPAEAELERMAARALEELEAWRGQIVGEGEPGAPVR
jgi:hypothetical protein